ncbi:MAG TPA: peptidoglycan DD-metalloendopeptidase family protein [Clostridiales bacterium]|nr:peptidoglycan DD-metalloendopeptidase family protein [Clostridiales bacterium]
MIPWPPNKKERMVSPVKTKRKTLNLTKVEQLSRKMGIDKKSSKSQNTISMAGLLKKVDKLKSGVGLGPQKALASLKRVKELQRIKVLGFKNLKPPGQPKKNILERLKINTVFVRYAAIGAGIVVGVSLITGAALYNDAQQAPIPAFSVVLDGQVIGYTKDIKPVDASVKQFKDELEQDYNMDVSFSQSIEYLATAVDEKQLTDINTINKQLKASMDVKVRGVAIVIDGKETVIVKDRATAHSIIEGIKAPYKQASKDTQLKEIKLAEDVRFKDKLVSYETVTDKEDAYKLIAGGTEEQKTYEVQDGDTLWSISKKHKITLDELMAANRGLDEDDTIRPGDKLNLTVPKNLINVVTKEVTSYTESIPFETKTQEDSSMYTNQSKVITDGQEGVKGITVEVIKQNGIEQQRVVIEEKVLKEPVDKVIAKGTKKPPETTRKSPKTTKSSTKGTKKTTTAVGTGNFSLPTRGTITSRFGMRWGKLHTGVDIGAPVGTPIRASDSGRVIFAGWSGGYGKLVKIDHGGGKVTYYAHCSSIAVSKGQKVSKGQVIARVGSTGNSTGPHLHFEIRINGKPINPLSRVR